MTAAIKVARRAARAATTRTVVTSGRPGASSAVLAATRQLGLLLLVLGVIGMYVSRAATGSGSLAHAVAFDEGAGLDGVSHVDTRLHARAGRAHGLSGSVALLLFDVLGSLLAAGWLVGLVGQRLLELVGEGRGDWAWERPLLDLLQSLGSSVKLSLLSVLETLGALDQTGLEDNVASVRCIVVDGDLELGARRD